MDPRQTRIERDDTERLGRIEYMIEDMHTRLFGNGQPGELDKLSTRLSVMDTEIDELKETKAHAKGAMWMVGALFTMLGGTELWHLFRK